MTERPVKISTLKCKKQLNAEFFLYRGFILATSYKHEHMVYFK